MGNYDLGQMRIVGGGGPSGLASRSQLAQARELERLRNAGYKWATPEWYNAKAEQQTVDGQVLCGDCGKPEPKRIKRGTPRPLTVDEAKERLICSKCDSKIRSQKARERIAKAEERKQQSVLNADWWKSNLAGLSETQRAELQAREDEVGELLVLMYSYMTYPPDDAEDDEILHKLIEDLKRDVKKHGLCTSGLMCIPGLCRCHGELQCDTQADRDAIAYGMLTGVPSQLYWDFVHRFVPAPPPKCMTYACPNAIGTVEPWYCDQCSGERKRRSDARHRGATIRPEDQLYTAGGKMSDLQNANAAWFARLPGE